MSIFHGDFFDEPDKYKSVAFHAGNAGNAGKMPFEDRVREYLGSMQPGATYEDCAKALGICEAAVYAAVANLQLKGIVAPADFCLDTSLRGGNL